MTSKIPPIFVPSYTPAPGSMQMYDLQKGFNTLALSMRGSSYKNIDQVSGLLDILEIFAKKIDDPHFLQSFTDICKTFEDLKS